VVEYPEVLEVPGALPAVAELEVPAEPVAQVEPLVVQVVPLVAAEPEVPVARRRAIAAKQEPLKPWQYSSAPITITRWS
jgi:hypothetical protein